LYPNGFDSNVGFFEAMMGSKDVIILDELNHASLIDGISLSKAKVLIYKHLDMQDLENKLKETDCSSLVAVVSDGVFSMDGNIAPLD
jgi:7-keto-8-aminopelargonate synthetase-like enzyme